MSIYSMGELYYPNSPDKPKYFDISDEVMDALDALRVEMANINGGEAWYTAVFRTTPDGKFNFDFDYDQLSAFQDLPDARAWLFECKKYPRPELPAHIQDWLDGPGTDEQADEVTQRLVDLQRAG